MAEKSPSIQTTLSRTLPRCVNLDWLEVHVREPITEPHTAEYYRTKGYIVHERDYGTRVYKEMFTIMGQDGLPLLEVRRNPSSAGLNGIHDINESHIRLVNRTCYYDDAAASFQSFLLMHNYSDIRISRVDICLDFVRFDKGDDPQAFVRRYFQHRYAKINQGRISSHGEDAWNGQMWNSMSWGSKQSAVTTKMYNKTMELKNEKDGTFEKPYIRQAWLLCGLIDDWQKCTKNGEEQNVWRVEFSLKSAVKGWIPIQLDGETKKYQSLRNTLDVYAGRDRLLVMFASLANHYFRFKKFKEGVRKDRCQDKILFDFSTTQLTYKMTTDLKVAGVGDPTLNRWRKLLSLLVSYEDTLLAGDTKKACEVIINVLKEENIKAQMTKPWSQQDLQIMQNLLSYRVQHPEISYEAAMARIKAELGIKNRTIDTF